MKTKTALVFGATGLIGSNLVTILQEKNQYDVIKVFLRNDLQFASSKVELIKIDFSQLDKSSNLIQGDDLYCCLGTTIKKAGSQLAFKKVDHDLVVELGRIAKANDVKSFLVISSLGAKLNSSNFYLRVKGEMEEALKKYQFQKLVIMRPSILLGERKEFRLGENIGKVLMKIISPFLTGAWKKYRAIHANTVAKAMVHLAETSYGLQILESDEIEKLANK